MMINEWKMSACSQYSMVFFSLNLSAVGIRFWIPAFSTGSILGFSTKLGQEPPRVPGETWQDRT